MAGSWHINSQLRSINLYKIATKKKKRTKCIEFQNLVQHQTANEFAFFFTAMEAFFLSRRRRIIVYRHRKVNSISYIQGFLSCHLQASESRPSASKKNSWCSNQYMKEEQFTLLSWLLCISSPSQLRDISLLT